MSREGWNFLTIKLIKALKEIKIQINLNEVLIHQLIINSTMKIVSL